MVRTPGRAVRAGPLFRAPGDNSPHMIIDVVGAQFSETSYPIRTKMARGVALAVDMVHLFLAWLTLIIKVDRIDVPVVGVTLRGARGTKEYERGFSHGKRYVGGTAVVAD